MTYTAAEEVEESNYLVTLSKLGIFLLNFQVKYLAWRNTSPRKTPSSERYLRQFFSIISAQGNDHFLSNLFKWPESLIFPF